MSHKKPNNVHHNRWAKILYFLLISLLVVASVWGAFEIQHRLAIKSRIKFESDTHAIVKDIMANSKSYDAVLYGARGLITSSQEVTQTEWTNFFKSQAIDNNYKGISSIFYVSIVPKDQSRKFEKEQRSEPFFGQSYTIQDTGTDLPYYGLARLIYAQNNISSGLGFDNFSTIERRQTYFKARDLNRPVSSQPIKLAIGPLGFFTALPVFGENSTVSGYVVISFRAEQFATALIADSNDHIRTKIDDISDRQQIQLYTSNNWSDINGLERSEEVSIGTRTWRISFRANSNYDSVFINSNIPRFILAFAAAAILLILSLFVYEKRRYHIIVKGRND